METQTAAVTLTAPELGMWLGNTVQTPSGQGKLLSVCVHGTPTAKVAIDVQVSNWHLRDVLPVVRSMDSITKNEALTLAMMQDPEYKTVSIRKIDAVWGIQFAYTTAGSTGIKEGSINLHRLRPNMLRYLLQLGLDVMDWAVKGQAIVK